MSTNTELVKGERVKTKTGKKHGNISKGSGNVFADVTGRHHQG
jgi:hypothetical protein